MKMKNWALEDRPREKLYQNGPKHLTNAELLAVILTTGTKSISAVDLARNILSSSSNDLNALSRKNIKELCTIKGVGPAKAMMIRAVMELANRKEMVNSKIKDQICSSDDAFRMLKTKFLDLKVEEFWVIYLNRANKVIAQKKLSSGGISGTVVDPKVIFHNALSEFACGLILAHNHPSGNLKPSKSDIAITKKIKQAGEFLDISVLDHLIFSENRFFSFADEGLM